MIIIFRFWHKEKYYPVHTIDFEKGWVFSTDDITDNISEDKKERKLIVMQKIILKAIN